MDQAPDAYFADTLMAEAAVVNGQPGLRIVYVCNGIESPPIVLGRSAFKSAAESILEAMQVAMALDGTEA